MSNGEVSLQMLAEILRGGSRDRQVIERTNPFLEHVGKALQERVGDLAWNTSLQHRKAVKEPQYLNRAYTPLPHPGLELMVALQPGEIWWGLHRWGTKEAMKHLREALQGSGLLEPGEEVLVRTGDFGGWRGGAYLTMGHSLTAEDVLQFPDEHSLVEHIVDDLAHWFKRFSSYEPPRPQFPGLEKVIAIFRQGFRDFADPAYLVSERNYKVEAAEEIQGLLSRDELARLIERGEGKEALRLVQRAFTRTNLCSPYEIMRLQRIPEERRGEFAQAVYNLLYGNSPWEDRFFSFSETLQNVTGQQATWPLVTYLPYLVFPEEHIFLKPHASQMTAQRLGFDFHYRSKPNIETYTRFQEMAHLLMEELAPLKPRDMIDIQSLIWRIGRGDDEETLSNDSKPGDQKETGQPIDGFQIYLSAHNYHFPSSLLATYYLSLQTKPFVILSGLSGTGKTKLAQYFAEWMGTRERAILIPVHPDWTDHRGLLGFCHLLTGTYHATDFLRLLLAAHVDWMYRERRPHFVILDEMNLARVEHYFADFLSVLESRRAGEDGQAYQDSFPLHDQPRCLLAAGNEGLAEGFCTAEADHKTCTVTCEGCPFQDLVKEEYRRGELTYEEACEGGFNPLYFVPPRLEVPLNVYFTGTVNVDETTFTFSPKVLDRANVIEFGKVDLEGYWRETGQTGNLSYTCADDSIVRALTHEFTYPFTTGLRQEALQELNLAPYREQLAALVHLLEPFHMHFGYRVADEMLVYLLNARCLDDPVFNLDAAFDCAVLQKILPRFHGARARLWQPLLRLLAFCTDDPAATEEQAKMWGEMSVERIREQAGPEPRLPRSTAKLLRMLSDLETEGFTSFT